MVLTGPSLPRGLRKERAAACCGARMQGIIRNSYGMVNSCFFIYYPVAELLYLYNDAYTAATSGILGSGPALSNSQCRLDLLHATTSGTGGNDVYLNLPIGFSTGYAGAENVYLLAYDRLAQYAGWTQTGSWTVAGSFPIITTTSLPAGNANVAYPPTSLSVSGETGTGYSWSATGLPAGLTLSAAGGLSGIPTTPCGFSPIPITRSPLKPITDSPSIPISVLP
jgi:hypothetical protein